MVLVVVIVVIAVVVLAASMYFVIFMALTPTLPPSGSPRALGVSVTRSADGTNWTLAFISVPTGMSPATTYVTLFAPSGATLLPATPLSDMNGMMTMTGTSDRLYMQYQGNMMGTVVAGDVMRIATSFAGTGASTAGCQIQISVTGAILYIGTLQ